MTANQIPYDQLDWLQIAIYFLALPIVALIGAAIGLFWRWRRGGMLWSTNVGLLGGAVACVILAFGLSTTGITNSKSFFDYFLSQYRWMMLITTLGATTVCAFVAGLAWRMLHAPREKQPLNISISNVMLVQFFAMISLGSFIGLRLYMLQTTGDLPVIQQQVRIHDWVLDSSGKTIMLDYASMSPQENEEALATGVLEKVAKIPSIEYAYFNLDGEWRVDLSPLLQHPKINTMVISLQQMSSAQLEPLVESKLKSLALEGDVSQIDLTRFSRAKSLVNFTLMGSTSRRTIESLSGTSIKHFAIMNAQAYGTGTPIRAWPQKIEGLAVKNSNLRPEDFASLAGHPTLKSLNFFDLAMTEKELAFLPTIPNLSSAVLVLNISGDTWHQPLAGLKNANLWLDLQSDVFSAEDAAHLTEFTQLKRLNLDFAQHNSDIADELAKIASLEHLTITSPDFSEEALLKLAVIPSLRALEFPPHLNTPAIIKKCRDQREALSLPHAHFVPKPRTLKPAPKQVNKASSPPKASAK